MSETVREWIAKAAGDFDSAAILLREGKRRNWDAVCYHAQQCAEKLLKAALIQRRIVPPRVHDLALLDQLLHSVEPTWSWPQRELRTLSRAAVIFRYPGRSANKAEARQALAACQRLRDALRPFLTPRRKKRRRSP